MNSFELRKTSSRLKKTTSSYGKEKNDNVRAGQRDPSPSASDDSSVFDDSDRDPTFDASDSDQTEDTENSDLDATMDREDTVIENIEDSNKENAVSPDLLPNNEAQNVQKTNKFQLSTYIKNKRSGKKKTNCRFCQSQVTNFERHLTRHHSDSKEVQDFLRHPKKSLERRNIIKLIRNDGNFNEYLKGNVMPIYRKKNELNSQYYPCGYCKGLYKKNFLYRHYKSCPAAEVHDNFQRVKHIAASQTLVACALDTSSTLDKLSVKKEVFSRMKADEISMTAKTDVLIYRYGERYLKKHKKKQMFTSCSNKIRELARLLIELRKIQNDKNFTLSDAIDPSMFKKVVECAKRLGGFNAQTKTFDNAPSLSAHLGTTLQTVCDELVFLIETGDQCVTFSDPEAKCKAAKKFKNLIVTQWTTEISSLAHKDLNEKKWNKPIILPLTRDVREFKNYVTKIANIAAGNLKTNPNNPQEYKNLVNATLALTILYNRRRIGDVQYTKLSTYQRNFTSINQEECLNALTESEKALTKYYKRVVTGGKGTRAVVILFPRNLQELVNVLIDVRTKTMLVPETNEYLFAQLGSNLWVKGDKAIQQFAKKCNLKHPEHITSNRLRKQIATVMQILNLNPEETDQFPQFMGHTTKTHNEFYKLPEDVYQTAKISKLLVLMDKGEGHMYKGKSLNEIEIDPEVEFANEEECEDNDLPPVECQTSASDIMQFPEPSTSTNNQNLNKKLKTCTQTGRTPWTQDQIKVVKNYFKHHIERKQAPKKMECEELIRQYPDLLKNKDWVRIKTYIYNVYRGK